MDDSQTQDQSGDQDDGTSQGYVIEIAVKADGTFSVDVESAQDEAGEEGSGEASDSSGQQVKSFAEALQVAKDIFKNGGQMEAGGDNDFAEGYGGAGQ